MDWAYNLGEVKAATTEEERLARALAVYNYGIGNFRKTLNRSFEESRDWKELIPNETKKYIKDILNDTRQYISSGNYQPKFNR
jgi:soluble lytic murein transglycosylase-like protein